MKKQLPNILTYSRILAVPVLAVIFLDPVRHWLGEELADRFSALLFLYAAITDFFDGYLARAWHAHSSLGKFLDPIADKLLVATCLMLLVGDHRADMFPAIAILCREILVSGLREFLADLRISVPVTKLAQYKTAAQMAAICLLLFGASAPWGMPAMWLGSILLWAAALLTLVTGYAYLKTGIRHLSEG